MATYLVCHRKRRWLRIALTILALASVSLSFGGAVAGKKSASTRKTYVFRGTIQSIDSAKRTFTLLAGAKSYIFRMTPETRMVQSVPNRNFGNPWRGQNAEVSMKLGPGGEGIAVEVRLVPKAEALIASVMAATTPDGRTLSADQVKPLIVHQEWAPSLHSVYWQLKLGVFLLAVRSDGTVATVDILQSTSHRALDSEIVRAFSKWRFRPNSVTEVRLPAYYVWRPG